MIFNEKWDLESPFDLVMFPSMGLFYADHRQGVMVRYLTGREENVLTSPMLIENGQALDFALQSVILEKELDIDKLLISDKNAIILFLRATAYGTDYQLIMNCPHCHQTGKTSFDITAMEAKDILVPPDENGEFQFALPKMKINGEKVKIKFRPLTYGDEKVMKINDAYSGYIQPGLSQSITIRYKTQITSVNGISDPDFIDKVIKKMPINDSTAFHTYMDKVEPGINNLVSLRCPNCTYVTQERFNIDGSFLGLTPEYKNVLWEESFLLWYYSQGGVTRNETFKMATAERKWAIQRINEEIQKKNEAEKKAQESSNRKSGN